jgi:4-amino-4-deoxy-L-arabinose transferase-like glycosyltransferase
VALEFLGPWVAVMAMLFLAVSPLDLALARRAWQDDVMALLTLLMVWAFLRHAARGGRGSAVAFFVISAYTLLVKESAVIAFGLGTLGLALIAWRRSRGWKQPLLVLTAGAAAALLALGVIVAVSGGWAELRRTLELGREALAPDDYLRKYQMGGVGYYVTGLRILQPVPFLLGALGAALAVLRVPFAAPGEAGPRARGALAALGWLVLGFGAVSFSYYSKNLRFLSPIYAPVCLLAAALVGSSLAALRVRAPRPVALAGVIAVVIALAASAVLDVRRFDHYFNELQIQDLATPWFTQADQDDR